MITSRRMIYWGLASIAVVLVAVLLNFANNNQHADSHTRSTTPTLNNVGYTVVGTAKYGDLTYSDGDGDIQQVSADIPLNDKDTHKPLWITFKADPGSFLSIEVQNGTDTGSVTCEIRVNGVIVKKVTSEGEYVIASCSGTW